jgi:putative addiction module component (TIGR02574 family)
MPSDFDDWKARIGTFTVEQRTELARALIESLDEDPDAQAAWDAELNRRVADIKSGRAIGRPAEQVYADLRKKYS